MQKVSYPKLHSIRLKNMDNVVHIKQVTSHDIDPNNVLMEAINAKLESAIVIGYDKEGGEYFASSYADGADVVWLLERMKKMLLEIGETGKREM